MNSVADIKDNLQNQFNRLLDVKDRTNAIASELAGEPVDNAKNGGIAGPVRCGLVGSLDELADDISRVISTINGNIERIHEATIGKTPQPITNFSGAYASGGFTAAQGAKSLY